MSKHLIRFFFLLAALGCYVLGLGLPAAAFIVLGVAFEIVFWARLLMGRRSP